MLRIEIAYPNASPWAFEGPEREELVQGVHLLCEAQDAARRAILAASREADSRAWECAYAEAQNLHRARMA